MAKRPPRQTAEDSATVAILPGLARIWSEVLDTRRPTPQQNFFEVGGNPTLAIRLCDQIRAELQKVVPPLILYSAPTLGELSSALSGSNVRFSNAIVLKYGVGDPPLFLLHGLGGNISEFFELVKCFESGQTIYGLQARGTDGLEPPLDRIEAMAEYHIEAIRQAQPHGPYLLCGYSLGGLVALEIARQFLKTKEPVALLSMIDSYPHAKWLPLARRLPLYTRRLHRLSDRIFRPSAAHVLDANNSEALSEKVCGPAIRTLTRAAILAWKHYDPKPYPGRVRFIAAATPTFLPTDPTLTWKRVIRELVVETVPATHHNLLVNDAPLIASALSRYVAEALV